MQRGFSLPSEPLKTAVLKKIRSQWAEITVLYDHHDLCAVLELSWDLAAFGYELYHYKDNLSLYYYLGTAAPKEQASQPLLIIVPAHLASEARLPYLVLKTAISIKLYIEDFFLGFSVQALRELPSEYYARLYELQDAGAHKPLTYQASWDFFLRQLYGIDLMAIKSATDFWALLFKMHYGGMVLAETALKLLQQSVSGFIAQYELNQLLTDKDYFFAFLQTQWELFIFQLSGISENSSSIDWQDPLLRVYVDNFFAEGILKPLKLKQIASKIPPWALCGIELHTQSALEKLTQILGALEAQPPAPDASYRHWQKYAKTYAEFLYLFYFESPASESDEIRAFREKVNHEFLIWMQKHYDALANLPATKPVMVHHIASHLAYHLQDNPDAQLALIVMDGMSYDQWLCIKSALEPAPLSFREAALFAWLPSLSSVSRQAIFSGSIPFYFANSIHTNSGEAKAWHLFWDDLGYAPSQIQYLRMDGVNNPVKELENKVNLNKCRVLGIVINVIDNILHGMSLGTAGMHSQIRHWLQQGHFADLLQALLEHGFELFLTADHGNLECRGVGKVADTALSETKASRVSIYQSEILRDRALKKIAGGIPWTPKGLPGGLHCLFADYRQAFIPKGKISVSHGGISLEEILVPLIKIHRKRDEQ